MHVYNAKAAVKICRNESEPMKLNYRHLLRNIISKMKCGIKAYKVWHSICREVERGIRGIPKMKTVENMYISGSGDVS